MRDQSSEFFDPNSHFNYCPIKHRRSALFVVAYFSLATLTNWLALHRGPSQPDLTLLLFAILLTGMFAKMIVDFTCFRDRLVFGIAILLLVITQVERYSPWVFRAHIGAERGARLLLSLLGLVVGLTMLLQSSFYPPKGEPGPRN